MPVSGAKLRRRAHPAVSNEMRRASVGLCSKLSRKEWLRYQDSNLGMSIPKTDALPLGDAPTSRRIYINTSNDATSNLTSIDKNFYSCFEPCLKPFLQIIFAICLLMFILYR